jgi:hypothetical protein
MKKIGLFLILALLVLAACDSKSTTQQNSQTVQEKTQASAEQVKETSQPKTQSLKDIFAGVKIKYTADYEITSEGKTMNTKYIMDLPKFAMETNTDSGVSRSIFDGTTFYVCSMAETEWQCFKMPMQNPNTVETEKGVNDGTIVPVYLGTCSQAGESGLKYSVTDKGVTSTMCYTADGILLEMSTSKMTMTATKVSRTVAADAFVPPAEPVDIPSIPQ